MSLVSLTLNVEYVSSNVIQVPSMEQINVGMKSTWQFSGNVAADLNEGRGRQRKRLKMGPWLTLLGFLSSPLLYECVRDRARAWVSFLWREKMSPLDVPHSRENLTRLNFSNMIGFPARDGWRGGADKEGKAQHLNSLSSHPATQITIRFFLMMFVLMWPRGLQATNAWVWISQADFLKEFF